MKVVSLCTTRCASAVRWTPASVLARYHDQSVLLIIQDAELRLIFLKFQFKQAERIVGDKDEEFGVMLPLDPMTIGPMGNKARRHRSL